MLAELVFSPFKLALVKSYGWPVCICFSLNKFIAPNGVLNFFLFKNARESIINYGVGCKHNEDKEKD
jgi:hypothetical protein